MSKDAYYVDRTVYLERLENISELYLFFLRPRRFGKSLWVSVLQYYYGIEHKDKFETLFGKYYIGQQPTPLANSYLVLKFDFSGIDTSSKAQTYQGFRVKVREGIQHFLTTYATFFSPKAEKDILSQPAPEIMIGSLFIHAQSENIPKIYVVIDEYDHFTNELISFRLHEFKEIVGAEGYVRSFYERIKTATGDGVVDRFFATGVAPITLDSLTSGFNIGTHISKSPLFNEMMGFTENEVKEILKGIEIPDSKISRMMAEIRKWYNGYLFEIDGKERMYNSDMVLYFAKEFQARGKYPDLLLRSRPPYEPPYQFMIELKFLYKKDADKVATVTAQGRKQLQTYLQAEEVQGLEKLSTWLWVFVGTQAVLVEEIN